ncbi:MAG: DUF3833 domain-containing protein [Rhodobacterales bacterium]|jgi:hypothetical protein|nr:DUF3833 domain-containing protein [Planktomarina sp.]MDA9100165.1 DUF3833 domain-containing protein [Planktomarina sp.]MDC3385703.1 DUF3833 domain-containing protein [Planktomarina sp.]|tara:strand:+ start:8767 stop:9288 length:522 start_codon:yes stop_codon:yes gene_type:complete
MFRLTLVSLLVFVTACSQGPSINDTNLSKLELNIEDFFVGKTTAYGQFQDRFGTIRSRFKVDIEGTWDGEVLTLVENFNYADQSTEIRIWKLKKTGENLWIGTAPGVVGDAIGEEKGDAFNFRYRLLVPFGKTTLLVTFDDWMWLLDEKRLFNRAYLSKYGVNIGEVLITFEK